jgi:hypothetical protein
MSRLVLSLVLAACNPAVDAAPAAPRIDWQPTVELATGGGQKGPWQQNNSKFDYVDDPSVALGADGAAYVAWVDHRTKDVWLQIYDHSGSGGKPRLTSPARVSRSPAVFSWLPRVTVDRDSVFVLWQEIVFSGGSHGGEIFFARSTDGGATFGDALNLSNSTNGDGKGRIDKDTWNNGSLDLARGPDGTLYAAWTEYDGALWFTRSRDQGQSFAKPLLVAGDATRPARAPALAVGDVIHLAWSYGEDPSADLHLATSADGENFAAPIRIAKSPGFSDAPKLALDRSGTLHVAYAEDDHIRYTRSRDRGKTFDAPREIPKLSARATFPSLAVDGRDVHIVFELHGKRGELARGLGIAVSRDGGQTFGARVVPGSTDPAGGWNGSHQGHLMQRLAVRDGTLAIGNSSLKYGSHSRVWLLRGKLR